MKVLSLFDGMACGLQALKEAGIHVSEYHAFEIDKACIAIAKKNHPEIIHHGEIHFMTNFTQFRNFDLLIGGSPCQGFSFAGKQLNFNDPRSQLFFEFVRARNEAKPKYFMLENVVMKQIHTDVITKYMKVKPERINSALLSAQNRVRDYWCNWKLKQPDDAGIILSDILEPNLPSCGVGARIVGRRLNALGKREDYNFNLSLQQYLEIRTDNKANCLTTVYKDSVVPYYKTDKRLIIKLNQGKASCLTGGGNSGGNHSDMDILVIEPNVVRRYSPTECERLQTLPDGYTAGLKPSPRYKMMGNGWTCAVIKHNFKLSPFYNSPK